jgi:NNP family nitrate/nitrite transporter-like MFS transporter
MTFLLIALFWSFWLLNFSSRLVLSPVLPLVEDQIRLSHGQAGSLFSFVAAGYTITSVLAGLISLRTGYKRAILGSTVIVIASLFLLQYANSYISLALLMFFIGIGTGLYMPSVVPIITSTFHRQTWGKAIAAVDTGASVGIFLVPIFTVIALRLYNWRTLFLFLSGACAVALILFWKVAPDPRPQKVENAQLFRVLRRSEFWIMLHLWLFASACVVGLFSVIPLFLVKERGLSLETANTVFGISRAGGICVSILAGYLADRYGAKQILFFVVLITGISTIGIALAQNFPLLVTMLVLEASVCTGFFPVGYAAISRLTSLEERGMFVGTVLAAGVIFGHGLTPALLGVTADALNFQTGILILGCLTMLCCLSLRRLPKI